MPLPPWAGVLARGFRRDMNPINADPAFPGSVIRVALLGLAHHSQWRDRSGFSPEFPVGPKTGTQGQSTQSYNETDPGVKSQTEFFKISGVRPNVAHNTGLQQVSLAIPTGDGITWTELWMELR